MNILRGTIPMPVDTRALRVLPCLITTITPERRIQVHNVDDKNIYGKISEIKFTGIKIDDFLSIEFNNFIDSFIFSYFINQKLITSSKPASDPSLGLLGTGSYSSSFSSLISSESSPLIICAAAFVAVSPIFY